MTAQPTIMTAKMAFTGRSRLDAGAATAHRLTRATCAIQMQAFETSNGAVQVPFCTPGANSDNDCTRLSVRQSAQTYDSKE